MPIDFFKEGCKTESTKLEFGLCDNPSPAVDLAYIDEANAFNWIAEIRNINERLVEFYAVDHCVNVRRANNEMAKRCDGILLFYNILTFIELKDRGHTGWISGGRQQLTETISFFNQNHDTTIYTKVNARICNKQRPLAVSNISTEVQKFKDETALILHNNGLLLVVDRTISI